jgi:7-keto-8-aminopelargonate synthetase-like enzyme
MNDKSYELWKVAVLGPRNPLHARCDAFVLSQENQQKTQRNVTGFFNNDYLGIATVNKPENSFKA